MKIDRELLFGPLACLLWGALANAAGIPELELLSDYQFSKKAVSTEKIQDLDPEQLNPHRSRWVLQRDLQLRGLEAVPLQGVSGKPSFGVHAGTVESHSVGFLRDGGAWYRPMAEFPCTAESEEGAPSGRFGTLEGARVAVDSAGRAWTELLKKEKSTLALLLSRVRAPTADLALRKGLLEYQNWLHFLEQEYHSRGGAFARTLEWKFYREEAEQAALCRTKSVVAARVPTWDEMMETPKRTATAGSAVRPLVKAPARRWNGLFSVRLNIELGSKKLNGQFLVDSSARVSTISSDWLAGQGIPESWVKVPTSRLEKFTWSGGEGLAQKAWVDQVEMSGFKLDQQEFLLVASDFFSPPEHLSSCCDGILGADFLQSHVVEFLPGPVTEVVLWPRENFQPSTLGDDWVWFEVAMTSQREILSSCRLESSAGSIPSVAWDTGSEMTAEAHQPWVSLLHQQTLSKTSNGWSLVCSKETVAKGLSVDPPSHPRQQELKESMPGVNLGMPLLSRGPFIFDLPHGRIWFQKKSFDLPVYENRSGMVVEYVDVGGERILKLMALTQGTASEVLKAQGLKPGMPILKVGGKPAEDLDYWDVEQALSGAWGNKILLEWSPRVLKKGEAFTRKKSPTRVMEIDLKS